MSVKKNFIVHLPWMMDREGESVTKRVETETTDETGRVIEVSLVDTAITAIIGMISKDDRLLSSGWLEYGDLVGLFYIADSIQEHDIIIKDGLSFEVIRTVTIEDDGGTALATTGYLRRRAS